MASVERQSADNFPAVEKIIRYKGESLLLKSKELDGKLVQAIRDCTGMTTLHLEEYYIGMETAEALGNVLKHQHDLKEIILRSVFPPRHILSSAAKNEIPPAVRCLLGSLMTAGAQLTVLDLGTNRFEFSELGGLWELLASPCCHTLEELYLSSNSLNCEGARLLSESMSTSLEVSIIKGATMKLKIFECSFNGIGDEGAKFISKFLERLNSLESVNLGYNDIGPEGIMALSKALSLNTSLRDLTLDGSRFSSDGINNFANCLHSLPKLETLNLTHCQLESIDVLILAAAFLHSGRKLKRINLRHNNIDNADALLAAVKNKKFIETVIMDNNKFTPEMEAEFNSKLFNIQRCVEPLSSDGCSSMSSSFDEEE